MGLRGFLKSLHPFAHRHKPRGDWPGPMSYGLLPGLARPIEDAPFVTEPINIVLEYYLTSPGFVTGDRYPRDVEMAEGEIGYWAIFDGLKIYPVARVVVKRPYEYRTPQEARAALRELAIERLKREIPDAK